MSPDALELAGQRALAEMLRLWSLDIVDYRRGSHPRAAECLEVISQIIDRNGWLPAGGYLGGNSSPQWCGMTAGWCWAEAGLDPRWLRVWFASTLRLLAWARYQPWNAHLNPRPPGAARHCAKLAPGKELLFDPRPGDIVLVGTGKVEYGASKGKPQPEGAHVTLCHEYDAAKRVFSTVSGNGGGLGPHGGPAREGVSARDFAIDTGVYRAMWIVRPAFGDLLAERPA